MSSKKNLIPNIPNLPEIPKLEEDRKKKIEESVKVLVEGSSEMELQYFVAQLKNQLMSRGQVANQPANSVNQQITPAIPANPHTQILVEDLKRCEKFFTKGYTVQYDPYASSKPEVKKENEGFDLIWQFLEDKVGKVFENKKVQDAVARFLESLANKIDKFGEGGNG